jgi:hypothetical protein
MPASTSLPTKAFFIANQIEILHECSICREPFDDQNHAPARLTGAGSCHHVFGLACLNMWLEGDLTGANKCPMCRKVLFQNEHDEEGDDEEGDEEGDDEEDDDEEDDDEMYGILEVGETLRGDLTEVEWARMNEATDVQSPSDESEPSEESEGSEIDDDSHNEVMDFNPNEDIEDGCDVYEEELASQEPSTIRPLREYLLEALEMVKHYHDAKVFVGKLWEYLYELKEIRYISDCEIESRIYRALPAERPYFYGYHPLAPRSDFSYKLWLDVLDVARDMIKKHHENKKLVELDIEELHEWLEKLVEALGWNLCDQSIHGGHNIRGICFNGEVCTGSK